MDKVVAVTVTFNDYDYLIKAINSLLYQTIDVYKIVVVDNNSKWEYKEKLKELKNDKLDIIWLDENLGGAGGFEKGMKYAYEKYDPDWYWIMDADAFPQKDCLKELLKFKDYSGNIGYLAPIIYGVDLGLFQLYHHKKLARFLERDLQLYHRFEDVKEVSDIEADAFVGPLFSKAAVKKVGFPNGGLFIYGDDLEYTYRITRQFKAYLIRDAVINHRDQPSSNGVQKPQNWWKDYYMYRNRFLFISKYSGVSLKGYVGYFLTILRCFKQIFINSMSNNNKHLKELRSDILMKSIKDGLNNVYGKTIDPVKFSSSIKQISKGE